MPQYSFTSLFAPGDMVVVKVDEARRNHGRPKEEPSGSETDGPKLQVVGTPSWMWQLSADKPKIYQVLAVRFEVHHYGANQTQYLLGGASGTDDLSALESEIELYKKEA